jgi:hypothetical protein
MWKTKEDTDYFYIYYDTSCGKKVEEDDILCDLDEFKYCPFCGKPLEILPKGN